MVRSAPTGVYVSDVSHAVLKWLTESGLLGRYAFPPAAPRAMSQSTLGTSGRADGPNAASGVSARALSRHLRRGSTRPQEDEREDRAWNRKPKENRSAATDRGAPNSVDEVGNNEGHDCRECQPIQYGSGASHGWHSSLGGAYLRRHLTVYESSGSPGEPRQPIGSRCGKPHRVCCCAPCTGADAEQ